MIALLVRDAEIDGVWHVHIDGLPFGNLIADFAEDLGHEVYVWEVENVWGREFEFLDEALADLVRHYKSLGTGI